MGVALSETVGPQAPDLTSLDSECESYAVFLNVWRPPSLAAHPLLRPAWISPLLSGCQVFRPALCQSFAMAFGPLKACGCGRCFDGDHEHNALAQLRYGMQERRGRFNMNCGPASRLPSSL